MHSPSTKNSKLETCACRFPFAQRICGLRIILEDSSKLVKFSILIPSGGDATSSNGLMNLKTGIYPCLVTHLKWTLFSFDNLLFLLEKRVDSKEQRWMVRKLKRKSKEDQRKRREDRESENSKARFLIEQNHAKTTIVA